MNPRRLASILVIVLSLAACAGPAASAGPTFGDAPTLPPVATAPADSPSAPPLASEPAASAAPADEWTVAMTDAMRYEPGAMTVRAGAPVTFTVTNDGVIVHEFFVGTEAEQLEHAAEMASGGGHHAHGNALSLDAGASDTLTMTFSAPGELLVGCHVPGHYEAGMVATLTVVD